MILNQKLAPKENAKLGIVERKVMTIVKSYKTNLNPLLWLIKCKHGF